MALLVRKKWRSSLSSKQAEKMGKATASNKVKAPRGKLYTQYKLIKGMHLHWQPKIGKTYKVQQNDRKWVLAKLINVCDKGMKPHYDAHVLEFHDAHAGKILLLLKRFGAF